MLTFDDNPGSKRILVTLELARCHLKYAPSGQALEGQYLRCAEDSGANQEMKAIKIENV